MWPVALLVGALAIVGALGGEAAADKARAEKLFEDGRKYLTAKEYALACTAFEQSHQADPAIGTQLNIALCYETWGKVAAAYRAYLEAERLAVKKADKRAKGARKKAQELSPKVPRLAVSIPADADPSIVVLLDGREVSRDDLDDELLVEPGHHDIEARVPGREPKRTTVEIGLGERKQIDLQLPPPPAARADDPPEDEGATTPPAVEPRATTRRTGRLYGGVGLTLGGVIAIGTAGFVSLVARQDYADAIASCPGLVCETRQAFDTTQAARRRATYMTFVGAGGAALVGVGIYLIVTSRGRPDARARPGSVELIPTIGPDGVGLAIGGRL